MIKNALRLLRIHQWLKNLMLFFPPFLHGTLLTQVLSPAALVPFFAFCLASSATYVCNDVIDCERDSHHPNKRFRPVAAGQISRMSAIIIACGLLVFAMLAAWQVSVLFALLLTAYLFVAGLYSLWLKEQALVDIFCIAAGFILRLEAGGAAFQVKISEWLFLSVFLLAVFLSTGKRLSEKQRLGSGAAKHRKALAGYPAGFLEGIMYLSGAAVLVTYAMYVISRHSDVLLYSVPLCCFGLLRYILRIQKGQGGDPTESLLKDIPLFIVGLLWVLLAGWGIYGA